MDVIETSRRTSTLPPPRLDNAADGTRGVQRFDLARALRSAATSQPSQLAPPAPADPGPILQATVKMAVPERLRRLSAEVEVAAAPAPLWALVACVSLLSASTVASALVYLALFR